MPDITKIPTILLHIDNIKFPKTILTKLINKRPNIIISVTDIDKTIKSKTLRYLFPVQSLIKNLNHQKDPNLITKEHPKDMSM